MGMMRRCRHRTVLIVVLLCLAAVPAVPQTASQKAAPASSLSPAEFNRLIRDLSEPGGYFFSDNLTSNEDSYLTVVDKLRQLGATGGAYVGVGPEQNFSYIAKIRPRLAFIVDIRRQAVIQHLMYKAIFNLSPTRAEFLSRLLSRPLPKVKALGANASLNEMIAYFAGSQPDEKAYTENLAAIRKVIQTNFQFPLTPGDQEGLESIFKSFRTSGLNVGFQLNGWRGRRAGRGMDFPSLRELLVQTDLSGKQGNFLAAAEDYDFVRGMQRRNLIIPIVGDFAGKKALAGVGDYLRKRHLTVTVFYLSNVEMLLFNGDSFADFVENVRKLPINDRSLFIRSAFSFYSHPVQSSRYRLVTLLQQIAVFLRDFDDGHYNDYFDLLTTHYIAP